MFKGFTFQTPDYEVITPQTHKSFFVRSLTVQEEEKLKGSLLTPASISEHLNRCIFNALTKKPEDINTFEDFLKNVTLKDRDALLYGLYHITYEEIRNYDISCGNCGKTYPVTVQASSTFDSVPYPGDDVLTKEVVVNLIDTNEGKLQAVLHQPTLAFEQFIMKMFGGAVQNRLDMITETMIIKRFQTIPETGDSVILSDRQDIVEGYSSLPAKTKRLIYEAYRKEFGQYGIFMKMQSTCIFCKHTEEISIDLVENFFRMAYTV